MSKYSLSSRIVKELPEGEEISGEITQKELKTPHKKRIKRILRKKNPVTCSILREEYLYSEEISDKKEKGYILTDDNKYLKIIPSGFIPLFLLLLLNPPIIVTGVAISILFCLVLSLKEPDSKPISDVFEEIMDYSGDELSNVVTPDLPELEERYTIIDGIIYQGEYLTISRGTAIPLGNNPENAKTGVKLEFVVLEKDTEIFRSPRLDAGTGVNFVPSDYLSSGIHDLKVVVNVWHENGVGDIGGNQHVRIKIVD